MMEWKIYSDYYTQSRFRYSIPYILYDFFLIINRNVIAGVQGNFLFTAKQNTHWPLGDCVLLLSIENCSEAYPFVIFFLKLILCFSLTSSLYCLMFCTVPWSQSDRGFDVEVRQALPRQFPKLANNLIPPRCAWLNAVLPNYVIKYMPSCSKRFPNNPNQRWKQFDKMLYTCLRVCLCTNRPRSAQDVQARQGPRLIQSKISLFTIYWLWQVQK